jgi:hypothetical protein
MTETQVAETEKKIEAPKGEPIVGKLLGGETQREKLENISYLIIFISAIMVSAGIGIGAFVQGTVFVAVIGAFFVMVGIFAYIASQFIGE